MSKKCLTFIGRVTVAAVLNGALILLASQVAAAQTIVIDPTTAEFGPSADHDRVSDDGTAFVDYYELQIFAPDATQPTFVVNLGKPAPQADGLIRVELAGLLSPAPLPDVEYVARVAAKGPAGTSVSDLSNPFLFSSGCSFALSAAGVSVPATASSGAVTVTTAPGCTWLASSAVTWVTLTSGAEGTGTASVAFDVAENTSALSRSGALTVAGQTFTVTQAGVPCSYSISPTTASVAAGGGAVNVTVTTAASCAWTATSGAAWLSVSSGSGSGSGIVTVTAAANTGSSSRTATVTVAGQTFAVTQAAPSGCTYEVSPASASMPAAGGTLSVTVTTGSSCSWTAASQTLWARITSGLGGYGNGTVTISVGTAITASERTGTLVIAGKTFTITQAGVPASCSYSISPTSTTVQAAGGTVSAAVTAPEGCSWTASSSAAWLTVTSGSGSGSGSAVFNAAANTLSTERSATATVAGQTLLVKQAGVASGCSYAISPVSATIDAAGGTLSVAVSTDASCSWTAASQTLWLSVTSGLSGKGNGTVVVTVKPAATSSTRTGTMSIAGKTFTVTQAGIPCTYAVTPTNLSVPSAGSTGSFTVTTALGCGWSAAGVPSWVSVSTAARTGSATLGYSVLANSGGARTATFTVAGVAVTISQAAATTASAGAESALVAAGFD